MEGGMKARWLLLSVTVMALLYFSACGGSGSSAHNKWTWVNGANVVNQQGIYGTQGTASPNNVPGARSGAVSWTDPAGNFWLFGGSGVDSTGASGKLNDLWKYGAGEWTWMGGSNVVNQYGGVYGTQGTAAPSNIPGARSGAVSWTDSAGNLWLFGGVGSEYSFGGFPGLMNDLWKYSAGEWTWVGGSNVVDNFGVYGTQGIASPNNIPPACTGAVSWTDSAGNFWLFGGGGLQTPSGPESLTDLWKYSAGEWTWVNGPQAAWTYGVYGTQGTAAPGNFPGARSGAVSWTDASGNLWLFGGYGDFIFNFGWLADLWKYSAGEWTWMSGPNTFQTQFGYYGAPGTAPPKNTPGARTGAVSWTDTAGNLWLFSGGGVDSTGVGGNFNDLWKYSAGEWTWMGGSNVIGQKGVYGKKGIASPLNIPGARSGAISWTDSAGNLWLFGGGGVDSTGASGGLNDLWKYEP